MMGQLPDPSAYASIGWVIVSLAAIVAMLNQGFKLADRVRGKGPSISPQPLVVTAATEFVRKIEFSESRESVDKQIANINQQLAEARRERITDAKDAAGSRRLLHEEVKGAKDSMNSRIERVRTEMGDQTNDVRKELSEKIDQVPDRVIAMLKNTGAI